LLGTSRYHWRMPCIILAHSRAKTESVTREPIQVPERAGRDAGALVDCIRVLERASPHETLTCLAARRHTIAKFPGLRTTNCCGPACHRDHKKPSCVCERAVGRMDAPTSPTCYRPAISMDWYRWGASALRLGLPAEVRPSCAISLCPVRNRRIASGRQAPASCSKFLPQLRLLFSRIFKFRHLYAASMRMSHHAMLMERLVVLFFFFFFSFLMIILSKCRNLCRAR